MPDPAAAPVDPAVARDIAAIARIAAVPKILQAVAHVTGLRFTAVARVTDCSWTACAVHDDLDFGMVPGTELALETTLCNEIRKHGQPIMFDQASAHPIFSKHPTPALYGFESYVSIPILRADGSFFGTLCALDPRPARLDDPDTLRTLELFAELISAQLEADDRLQRSEGELLVAEDNAKLREQFIAVLGHDLRSPLQALAMGTELLRVAPLHAKWGKHLDRMEDSCLRMGEMIGKYFAVLDKNSDQALDRAELVAAQALIGGRRRGSSPPSARLRPAPRRG